METPSLDQALETIRAGFRQADAALDAMPDAVKAIVEAGQFGETAKKEVRRLAEKTRGRQVRRGWKADRLTLAVLADEVTEAGEPVTPQRLGQLAAEAKETP
jgi:hypothetical protein